MVLKIFILELKFFVEKYTLDLGAAYLVRLYLRLEGRASIPEMFLPG